MEQVEQVEQKTSATLSRHEVIGMGMVGYWYGNGGFLFEIELILAVKIVNNLEYFIEELISRK